MTRKGRKTRLSWADEQEQYLRDNYRTISYPVIAKHLGKNPKTVQGMAWKLGLKRTPEEQHAIAMKYNAGLLKKGNKSWNEGKKGVRYSPATEFKKGALPHNTKADGAISIRKDKRGIPYKHIRVALGKWEYLQRYNWEQLHGKIEKGQVLRCKDGNTLNCEPDNWYLTDRKKNMEKNSGVLRLPDTYIAALLTVRQPELRIEILKNKDLLQTARLNIQLKRAIKQQLT